MQHFEGFGFSGFRSFAGDVSWVPMKGPITLVLGANNSGKSSVVRLVLALPQITRLATENVASPNVFAQEVDAPRFKPGGHLQVWLPIDIDPILSRFRTEAANRLHVSLTESELVRLGPTGSSFLRVEFSWQPESIVRDDFATRSAADIEQSNERIWREALVTLTGSGGGGSPGVMVDQLYGLLRRNLVRPPRTRFVPPVRQISTSGYHTPEPQDSSVVDGSDMISTLYKLKNSGRRPELESYKLICHHMAQLLRDPTFDYVIPEPMKSLSLCLGGEFFPIESIGTGTVHALMILVASLAMETELLVLEEPDVHMHPRMQRELLAMLRARANSGAGARILATTHSPHLIDASADELVRLSSVEGTSTAAPIGTKELFGHLSELGYRASDLVQSDSIVWVEGPSDRLYLNYWLSSAGHADLVEGIHYSVVFYGGSLLSEMTADMNNPPVDLVDLRRINQNLVLMADRDRVNKLAPLKTGLQRLQAEIMNSRRGMVWITEGYTIENYIPHDILFEAVQSVHPSVKLVDRYGRSKNPLRGLRLADGSLMKSRPKKVRIASEVVARRPTLVQGSELEQQVQRVATFIRQCSTRLDPLTD